MNLRKDHYRVPALTGRSPTLDIYSLVALAGRFVPRAPARACPPETPTNSVYVSSEYYIIVKTFNNGSLGSGIDEERSEMR